MTGSRSGDCAQIELLLAARSDGTLGPTAAGLLARHVAECDDCRAISSTLSPRSDEADDLPSLPRVDPASYELGLEVARGGMGRILAAWDQRIGREVAVKELLGGSAALAARFEREARVTARLQHPGIVPIYEIGAGPTERRFTRCAWSTVRRCASRSARRPR
jgi:serine/threonine protein kinase